MARITLNQIEAFAKDKQRIWLMLYRIKDSPLDKLLLDHPEKFEKLQRVKKIRQVQYQLFRVKDAVHASTATFSKDLRLTTHLPFPSVEEVENLE